MATNYYSSLYAQAPFRGQVNFLPQAQNVNTRAQDFASFFTFTLPSGVVLATGDIIHLIPATPAGFKLTRYTSTMPGYDGGAALVGNLGFLSQANTGIVAVTAATLRAGGQFALTDAQLLAAATASGPVAATLQNLPPGQNDELVIYITTGAASAGTNGASQFLVEGIVP